MQVDRMVLMRHTRTKREGMAIARSLFRTFFGRFRHDSIILITFSKHYDLVIIQHGCKQ